LNSIKALHFIDISQSEHIHMAIGKRIRGMQVYVIEHFINRCTVSKRQYKAGQLSSTLNVFNTS